MSAIIDTAQRHAAGRDAADGRTPAPGHDRARKHGESALRTSDHHNRAWLVRPFEPISLKHLDATASMLVRRDNKYVLRSHELRQAIAAFAQYFNVLEIDGQRAFDYETCYFDDAANTCYFDHHRGRRKRFKARIRKYVNAQLCYVEIKFKGKRGITTKERLRQAVDRYGRLDDAAIQYIRNAYREFYGREFDYRLEPAVETHNQRATLVAKDGGERMTIDFDLRFIRGEHGFEVDRDLLIVETKSANANGIADKILRRLHLHPTNSCSKYCVAMAALRRVDKHNKFLPALRKLDAVPKPAVSKASAQKAAIQRAAAPKAAVPTTRLRPLAR